MPSVAAVVIRRRAAAPGTNVRPSAARTRPASARIATTAAKESCHRGRPPRGSEHQRRRRRHQQRIRARGGAPGERGEQARGAHHSGAWIEAPAPASERTPRRGAARRSTAPAGRAQAREQRQRERGEQHHVLARSREQMCKARAAEVLPNRLGEPLVLAQDHSRASAASPGRRPAATPASARERARSSARHPPRRAPVARISAPGAGVRAAAALEVVQRAQRHDSPARRVRRRPQAPASASVRRIAACRPHDQLLAAARTVRHPRADTLPPAEVPAPPAARPEWSR